jgi:hypothetical protein
MKLVRSGVLDRPVKPGDDVLNPVTLATAPKNQKAGPKPAI